MVVQHNISAMNANRYYGINNSGLSKSLEKLSSGYAINRAGDNAAGLAVSEKMRSQIGGLTQGVKNAQDGISMIQTFEGALTETDSILQRMKTLADQAANGTYQDDVDRDAIQLEFDQLNDELNQIADTDFNGVIVLNGGEMSDGLRQVDGKFDYANRQASYDAKVAELTKQIADLRASAPIDISTDSSFRTVDENDYGITQSQGLWDDLGLNADTDKYVDVTYTAKVDDDGNVTYEITKAVTDSGKTLDDTSAFEPTAIGKGTDGTGNNPAAATGQGGFEVGAKGDDAYANVIFDASKVKTGDVITLRYDGPGVSPKAPANTGLKDDSLTKPATAEITTSPKVESKLEDDDMTADMVAILDALQGMKFTVTTTNSATAATPTAATVADRNGNALTLGTAFILKDDAGNNIKDSAGNDLKVIVGAVNGGKVTISTVNAAGTADTAIADVTLGQYTDTGANSYSFEIAFDSYTAPSGSGVDIKPVATSGVGDKELNTKISRLQAKLDALQNSTGVSNSDAFDQAAIPMTYTDHIVLQAGARSKDAVDFTFKYSCGGMGKLEANMNCSARADGLNTENLYLTTAKDANAAIDQIDNAINKVSMVRATFGAVQNRLEHKIDNMNVTKENLTSAESRIRDTNIAEEMANFTKNQILSQASQSMLAQANSLPQGALQLLG